MLRLVVRNVQDICFRDFCCYFSRTMYFQATCFFFQQPLIVVHKQINFKFKKKLILNIIILVIVPEEQVVKLYGGYLSVYVLIWNAGLCCIEQKYIKQPVKCLFHPFIFNFWLSHCNYIKKIRAGEKNKICYGILKDLEWYVLNEKLLRPNGA